MFQKPAVVLDTNVVLDWLVFQNTECAGLIAAIEAGQLRWVVNDSLRGELAHVLARGVVNAWAPDETKVWAHWARYAHPGAETPALAGTAARLRCTDPDDQKFVDLALSGAQWLISRDRAVLKLARRAAPLGLVITTPRRWTMA